jgi:hypothetical protein
LGEQQELVKELKRLPIWLMDTSNDDHAVMLGDIFDWYNDQPDCRFK